MRILPKKYFLLFFSVSISIFLASSVFFRFLQFNRTALLGKIVIFLPLFLSFLAAVSFCLPYIENFFCSKWKFLVICVAIAVVGVTFYFLPYQFAPFRTDHSLTISVPVESLPVTLIKVTDSDNNGIDLSKFGITSTAVSGNIFPGQSVSYQQPMTGGLTVFIAANNYPSIVDISWDGVSTRYEITQNNTPVKISTNASSWGSPQRLHIVLAIFNLLCDGISSTFLLLFIFQFSVEFFKRKSLIPKGFSDDNPYVDYKILLVHFSLIIIAILSLNLEDYSSYLPALIMGASLALWFFTIFQRVTKNNSLIHFIIFLSLLSVICNIWLFPKEADFGIIRISKINYSMSSLVDVAGTTTTIMISVGYYKQLDQANVIVPESLVKSRYIDPDRLSTMNHLKSIKVIDYSDILNEDQYDVLIKNDDIIACKHQNIGMFYLLDIPENTSRTYVIYQYKNDLFLLPENYLKVNLL